MKCIPSQKIDMSLIGTNKAYVSENNTDLRKMREKRLCPKGFRLH